MLNNILKEQIEEGMKKEIYLMREVLANMQEEEAALFLQDQKRWTDLLQNRFFLIEKLGEIRNQRCQALLIGKNLPNEQIFPKHLETDIDLQLLSDQMISLIEKLNMQQIKNSSLIHYPHLPSYTWIESSGHKKQKVKLALYVK